MMTNEHLWSVLRLFLIPIGGGIPAGVLVARDYGFSWQIMTVLYLISDIILALVFEPTLMLLIALGKKWSKINHAGEVFKQATQRTLAQYGNKAGPFALITIAFGVDPMTGRSAAVAAGHGPVMGWIFAITGDMFYFALLMVSTLWLDGILGDGTATTLIIMALMFFVPVLIRKYKERRHRAQ